MCSSVGGDCSIVGEDCWRDYKYCVRLLARLRVL